MLLSSTTLNGAVSNDSNNNITMSVGNTVIANVNSSGIYFESGKKAIYTGAVLQVVNYTYSPYVSTSSSTLASLFGTSITPTSASSKILINISLVGMLNASSTNGGYGQYQLFKNGSFLSYYDNVANYVGASNITQQYYNNSSITYLDSPNTTSSTTYAVYWAAKGGATLYINNYASIGSGSTVSSMTLMEIAG